MLASAPGPDITVGRDASLPAKIYKRHIRVDIAAKQAITRVHMVLHADLHQWVAIDEPQRDLIGQAQTVFENDELDLIELVKVQIQVCQHVGIVISGFPIKLHHLDLRHRTGGSAGMFCDSCHSSR